MPYASHHVSGQGNAGDYSPPTSGLLPEATGQVPAFSTANLPVP